MKGKGLPHLPRKKEDMDTSLYARFDLLNIMCEVYLLCLGGLSIDTYDLPLCLFHFKLCTGLVLFCRIFLASLLRFALDIFQDTWTCTHLTAIVEDFTAVF